MALDLDSLPDAQLVAQTLAGSHSSFQEIVRRYQRPVLNLISRIVGDWALAEDVAQEAFLKTFRSLASFDRSRRFSSWILRIANNAAIDASRRRKADARQRGVDAVDVALPPAPDSVELADLSDALSRALDALRPTWRTAIVLRYHEGCSYAEIAEVLGVPEGTAKTFVHRARSQMANMLTQAGWRP